MLPGDAQVSTVDVLIARDNVAAGYEQRERRAVASPNLCGLVILVAGAARLSLCHGKQW